MPGELPCLLSASSIDIALLRSATMFWRRGFDFGGSGGTSTRAAACCACSGGRGASGKRVDENRAFASCSAPARCSRLDVVIARSSTPSCALDALDASSGDSDPRAAARFWTQIRGHRDAWPTEDSSDRRRAEPRVVEPHETRAARATRRAGERAGGTFRTAKRCAAARRYPREPAARDKDARGVPRG
ncbi:hypothetical protein PsYK624_163760 [Phanerochaete sordida]|uniref:Uncharacterized protein n=1 Tax=Phanerochaete sordida TaxID=48140 RepID=A0A9P3GSL7_9APHY|nr:hypothetical protein PsYK624_163760 [Phanerochaete sordida]